MTIQRKLTNGDLPVDVFGAVTTDASGTEYTALASVPGTRVVRFVNPTQDLQVRQVGGTNTITVTAGTEGTFYTAQDSAELEVRRLDQSNAQITVGLLLGTY